MEVIPAVDLMGGRCVQLIGGDPKTKVDYGDPVETALGWRRRGARILHVVDLDAALGLGSNLKILPRIKRETRMQLEFGGGIRTVDRMLELLRLDIDRIIVGTLAVRDYEKDFEALREVNDEFSEKRVVVAVDSKQGYVTVKGWQEKTNLKAVELIKASEEHAWGYLYTDVDVEGRMQGIDVESVRNVVSATEKPVIVSGGISSREDVDACREAGAWGVVLGKALYEGRIELGEVIKR